jgi:hypothetical protein
MRREGRGFPARKPSKRSEHVFDTMLPDAGAALSTHVTHAVTAQCHQRWTFETLQTLLYMYPNGHEFTSTCVPDEGAQTKVLSQQRPQASLTRQASG